MTKAWCSLELNGMYPKRKIDSSGFRGSRVKGLFRV